MAKMLCLLNNRNEGFQTKALEALSYNSNWETHSYKNRSVYMAALDLPFKNTSDYWLEDDDFVLMIDGEIMSWNIDVGGESVTRKLLNLYLDKGADLVQYLNGNFSIIIYGKKDLSLFVANDRIGLRPLYYFNCNGKICFSSEVKALATDSEFPRKINFQSIIDLLTYEYVLEEQTLIENIFVFPYASTALIEKNKEKVNPRCYWDFQYSQTDQSVLTDGYMEQFLELFKQAVERTYNSPYFPVGLPLSGGLDSRLIAAVTDLKYSPINTFTFGEQNCDDVKYAKRISNIIVSNHHHSPIQYHQLASFFEKGVSYCDGMVSCLHHHYLNMTDNLSAHVKIGLDGMAGDVFPRRMYSYLAGKDVNEVYKAYDTVQSNFRMRIFRKRFSSELGEARRRFNHLFEQATQKCPANPIDYLNVTQRQRKFINYGKVGKRNYVEMRMPFLDYDLMDFCLKMPMDFRLEGKLVKNIFKKYYPELARVPKANAGPLFPNRLEQALNWRIRELKSKLKINMNYADYNKYFRTFLKEFIYSNLTSAEFKCFPYFQHEEISKMLEEHFSGRQNYEKQIAALLTISLWSKKTEGLYC
ncbi:MAG: hypothetical protein KBD53_03050 [Candidatus Omnitrophica bacterium]|nr:hypothetical protein [Candidatus Omnitrophota bacterium]